MQSAGVILKYTNFTQKEIDQSIKHHVNMLKDRYSCRHYPSPKPSTFRFLNMADDDFDDMYYTWSCENGNNEKKFENFKKYLEERVRIAINEFTLDAGVSAEKLDPEDFQKYTAHLSRFKQLKGKNTREENISHDIENFLLVKKKNEESKSKNIISRDCYIITSDQVFINWAKEIMPSEIPAVVLPSVWYGILLQLKGRSHDDCVAFTQFLKLRMSENITQDIREKNEKIIQLVLGINEGTDITAMIFDTIKDHFSNSKYEEEYEAEEIVDKAREATLTLLEKKHAMDLIEIKNNNDLNLKNKDKELHKSVIDSISESCKREIGGKINIYSIISHLRLFAYVITLLLLPLIILFASYFIIVKAIPYLYVYDTLIRTLPLILQQHIDLILKILNTAIVSFILKKKFLTYFTDKIKNKYEKSTRISIFCDRVKLKCNEAGINDNDIREIYPEGIKFLFNKYEQSGIYTCNKCGTEIIHHKGEPFPPCSACDGTSFKLVSRKTR